jgi:hypothetical protein
MLDERQIELIQADVDGELPADQRAELSRLLLGNSEARALHDDLRKLTRMFSTLPRHEPPVGLERAVVDSIQWRAPSRRPAAAWRESAPRIAATVAGAALLVAALYHLGLPFGANVDRSELSGTMASPAGGRVATLPLDLEGVRGTVTVRGPVSARMIEFDVAAAAPVDVVTVAGGVEKRYRLEPLNGQVRESFRLEGAPDKAVELEFYSSGTRLGEARLELMP